MRRALVAISILALAATGVAPAHAGKRHKHKRAGIDGVVLNSTCYGPCAYPTQPGPAYSGSDLTVTVTRVVDGVVVATQNPSDGHFRFRLHRGLYQVTAYVTQPVYPQPQPQASAQPPSCWQGDSQQARVYRHRFTHIEMHVSNACVV